MAQLLTVKQAVGRLGVSRSTLYKMLDDRAFRAAPIRLEIPGPPGRGGGIASRALPSRSAVVKPRPIPPPGFAAEALALCLDPLARCGIRVCR